MAHIFFLMREAEVSTVELSPNPKKIYCQLNQYLRIRSNSVRHNRRRNYQNDRQSLAKYY
jgi:hypothetical protein